MKKTSEILKNKNIYIEPYFNGAMFSRIIETDDNSYFLVPISFKPKTKYNSYDMSDENIKSFKDVLNNIYKMPDNNWILKSDLDNIKIKNSSIKPQICCVIENDAGLKKKEFLRLLYFNLLNNPKLNVNSINDEKKKFIRGFFESRGSIDYKAKFYSIDYYYDSEEIYDLKRALVLYYYLSIPEKFLNINFRELQPDYKKGKKRNTQVRINLDWYISEIGLSFPYRIDSIKENCEYEFFNNNGITYFKTPTIEKNNLNNTFISRINLYGEKILNKTLKDDDINKLRIELGIDSNNSIVSRSQAEKLRVYLEKPDECCGCKNLYDLKYRSFIKRNDEKYYLEIHHNISFSHDKENLDIFDNMVKLCPICHSALKKNRANEEYQKEIIKNILNNDPYSRYFAETYFNIGNDENKEDELLIQKIYESLK